MVYICLIYHTIKMVILRKQYICQSAVSHQLRVLKNSKIVKPKRVGKQIFYSLDDEHIKKIYDMGLEHIVKG